MHESQWVSEIEAALAFPDTALIIRGPSAIAELRGPLVVRRGPQWLTLGEDAGSHVHLRCADLARCRFVSTDSANAMLEVLDATSSTLCKVSFRGTNPTRPERYDPELAERVRTRFGHLAG